jgi:hypothetical protein
MGDIRDSECTQDGGASTMIGSRPFFLFRRDAASSADGVLTKRVRLNGPPEALTSAPICPPIGPVLFFSTAEAIPCENLRMARVGGVPFSKLPRAKQHAIFIAQRKQRATVAENVFSSDLASLGLSYRFQRGFYTPYYRIADFYVP